MKFTVAGGIILCIAIFISSCKEDNQPVVLVTPVDVNLSAQPHDLITFEIQVMSDIRLAQFTITTQLENAFRKMLLDTALGVKNFNYTYDFIVPDSLTTGSMIFEFSAVDEDGNLGESARRVFFSSDAVLLTESAGHVLYSRFSGKTDAFDIDTRSSQLSTFAADSLLDIADYDTIDTDAALEKSWFSPAGGKFVSFSGFDYANATDQSVSDAFESGIKLDVVTNLAAGEILLTKLGSTTANIYAVIKVTDIADTDSTENDKYVFNLKR